MGEKIKRYLKLPICGILIVLMLFMTGCWDRTEINDIALITATAYDTAPDGKLRYSMQIMLPSGSGQGVGQGSSGGQQKKNFIVETAIGIDPGDAEKNIQRKFPRRLFRGHRRVIIIGEELARQGLDKMLDSIGRDPQNRLHTNVLIAKDKKGIDMLNVEYPIERVPSEAMREMMIIGIKVNANIRDFLMAASSEGIQPIAVAIGPGSGDNGFEPLGIAVFHKLKLIGYLDPEKTEGYLWTMGKFENGITATEVPGDKGVIRANVKNSKARITPELKGDKVLIKVDIKGEGSIYGNSTKLDLATPKYILFAQKLIKNKIKVQVEDTIKAVQKEYGADIFGFGGYFQQFKPRDWKNIEKKWDKMFPEAEVEVSVDFKIKTSGMSGPPLYLEEKEVKKK